MRMKTLVFIPNKPKRERPPKIAEDGQAIDGTTPYYVYICANPNCGCCGWIENWVDKQDNHKCSICGKVKVRVANPRQVSRENYDREE